MEALPGGPLPSVSLSSDDAIVLCDGCDAAVHQSCYNVGPLPDGEWFCEYSVCLRFGSLTRRQQHCCNEQRVTALIFPLFLVVVFYAQEEEEHLYAQLKHIEQLQSEDSLWAGRLSSYLLK
ncbi:PHD-finger domain-containing protein, putative, partial [Eimeria maxima]